ncbi:MAG: nitroreductase family protein, partial [Candidatus Thioglobus sp.]|nr:nitroreductase family protein [Candidatus Thioglobus sp.]MBT5286274.1 nitroreductase family protein [Candidatus Thioglobus sp.]MBT5783754.1 nitroreductase family protein [Candidatus Thioglobus sp.]MBT7002448.1 nitroreductase family protein [Candidatus Thioglobus sp.]
MLDQNSLDTLFINARSHNGWLDQDVSDEQIHQIYELMK